MDALLALHISHIRRSFNQIPLRRELAHLLILQIIFEKGNGTRHEVALLILSLCVLWTFLDIGILVVGIVGF